MFDTIKLMPPEENISQEPPQSEEPKRSYGSLIAKHIIVYIVIIIFFIIGTILFIAIDTYIFNNAIIDALYYPALGIVLSGLFVLFVKKRWNLGWNIWIAYVLEIILIITVLFMFLSGLNSTRPPLQDTKIKYLTAGVRAAAAFYYNDNNNYGPVANSCDQSNSMFIMNESIRNCIEEIEKYTKTKASCYSDVKSYAVSAKLLDGIQLREYWCVDSTGFAYYINQPITGPDCHIDWKIYKNEEYGVEFEYPENWYILGGTNQVPIIVSSTGKPAGESENPGEEIIIYDDQTFEIDKNSEYRDLIEQILSTFKFISTSIPEININTDIENTFDTVTKAEWGDSALNIEVLAGTLGGVETNLVLKKSIKNATMSITGSLSNYLVDYEPKVIESREAGKVLTGIIISVPRNAPENIYKGSLNASIDDGSVSISVPITLIIKHATSNKIPETISMPSIDRIPAGIDPDSVIDEALIAFEEKTPDKDKKAVIQKYSGVFMGSISELNMYQVAFPVVSNVSELDQIINKLNSEPIIEMATRSWLLSVDD
ncbi:MAG: hypothetical protein JW740_03395 [Candidatus Zambryskibacteria bacterium]|nr:hypothetical protein [Candidatus Zambryskibacteria bacterium]